MSDDSVAGGIGLSTILGSLSHKRLQSQSTDVSGVTHDIKDLRRKSKSPLIATSSPLHEGDVSEPYREPMIFSY